MNANQAKYKQSSQKYHFTQFDELTTLYLADIVVGLEENFILSVDIKIFQINFILYSRVQAHLKIFVSSFILRTIKHEGIIYFYTASFTKVNSPTCM